MVIKKLNNMNNLKIMMLTIFTVLMFGHTRAQYTGPSSTDRIYTVKEIKENASQLDKSDELVRVRGFIVKQINKDTFQFQDKTGTIKIELKKKYMPAEPFDEKTELILTGEVDYDFLEGTEIEVEEVEFVKKTNS